LKPGGTLEGVRVPARIVKQESVDAGSGKQEIKTSGVDKAEPLKLSGIDSDRHIAVEFVSTKNYDDLGGGGAFGSVQNYNFKVIAEHVAAQVKKQGKDHVFLGVFYDPSPEKADVKPSKQDSMARLRYDSATKNSVTDPRPTKDDSKELLRQQVRDFIAWLKEQKAIQ
jgi:hypothetical protein